MMLGAWAGSLGRRDQTAHLPMDFTTSFCWVVEGEEANSVDVEIVPICEYEEACEGCPVNSKDSGEDSGEVAKSVPSVDAVVNTAACSALLNSAVGSVGGTGTDAES